MGGGRGAGRGARGRRRLGYAAGHALNDGCAAVWFTYALSYLAAVAGVGQREAGALVLLGQLVDGFATPVVGLLCDTSPSCGGFGRRRPYHLAGVVLVAGSFPFIFGGFPFARGALQVPVLASAVTLFQVGWATSQVSHLALVPDLAASKEERTSLNSLRYGTTVACSLGVYIACWFLFGTSEMADDGLGPEALGVFRWLAIGIIVMGVLAAAVFHVCLWGTEEGGLEGGSEGGEGAGAGAGAGTGVEDPEKSGLTEGLLPRMEEGSDGGVGSAAAAGGGLLAVRARLSDPRLWLVGVLYVSARLVTNLTMVYFPLYLTTTLALETTAMATVPLLCYLGSWACTLCMKSVNKRIGRSWTLGAGLLIAAAAGGSLQFLGPASAAAVYGVAPLLGFGGSSALVTALSMAADVANEGDGGSAFVFGVLSFLDKVATGLAVLLIQHLTPCGGHMGCAGFPEFYRWVMVLVPVSCAGLAIGAYGLLTLVRTLARQPTATA